MKPVHEMTVAEALEVATRRELNRRAGRPLDAPPPATGADTFTPHDHATARPVPEAPAIVWPLRFTLPWSHLVSDNCRFAAGTERRGGGLLLTTDYRRCRGLIRDKVRDLLGHPAPSPVAIPLRLEARVWVPDEARAHDVCNFAKAVHDSLQGVVVTNDRWLWDTRWIHAGADVDAPRAELTITPLPAAA
jgi:hypothetical protein